MKKTAEIVFGTKNKAKVDQLRGALDFSHVHIVGLDQFGDLPDVAENGATLMENAIKKATTYASAIGRQVLSMDNGLYFDGLPDSEQPGVHVRRINGVDRATDDELLASYTGFINAHGGEMTGQFVYGVALAQPDGRFIATEINDRRLFVDRPCTEALEGYPLESLSIDPATNRYVAEMTELERADFWQRVIGEPIAEFIEQNVA